MVSDERSFHEVEREFKVRIIKKKISVLLWDLCYTVEYL